MLESGNQIPKWIRILNGIQIFFEIRITDHKIRIPPDGSQKAKKIRIPDPGSRIRPTSRSKAFVPKLLPSALRRKLTDDDVKLQLLFLHIDIISCLKIGIEPPWNRIDFGLNLIILYLRSPYHRVEGRGGRFINMIIWQPI